MRWGIYWLITVMYKFRVIRIASKTMNPENQDKRMTRWPIYAAFLIAAYIAVNIADALKAKCYEINPPETETRQILLNKCTGDTWLLVKTNLADDKGKDTDSFTFRWYALARDYVEPALSYDSGKK